MAKKKQPLTLEELETKVLEQEKWILRISKLLVRISGLLDKSS